MFVIIVTQESRWGPHLFVCCYAEAMRKVWVFEALASVEVMGVTSADVLLAKVNHVATPNIKGTRKVQVHLVLGEKF